MKLAIVSPVTSTPPNSGGSSNRSRSQASAIASSFEPSGDDAQAKVLWSSAEVSQSAPRAAGVVPPWTK